MVARSSPQWSTQDPDNLATGGVVGTFEEIADTTSICASGTWRTVFHVNCATLLPASQLLGVSVGQADSDECTVNVFMASPAACAAFTITAGWVIVAAVCSISFVYVVFGVLLSALWRGRLGHPHSRQWKYALHLISDGSSVVARATGKCFANACLSCLGHCPGWGDAARGETSEFAAAPRSMPRRGSSWGSRTCLAAVQHLVVWRDQPVVGPHIHGALLESAARSARVDSAEALEWLQPELTQDALSVGSSFDGLSDDGSMSSSSGDDDVRQMA